MIKWKFVKILRKAWPRNAGLHLLPTGYILQYTYALLLDDHLSIAHYTACHIISDSVIWLIESIYQTWMEDRRDRGLDCSRSASDRQTKSIVHNHNQPESGVEVVVVWCRRVDGGTVFLVLATDIIHCHDVLSVTMTDYPSFACNISTVFFDDIMR